MHDSKKAIKRYAVLARVSSMAEKLMTFILDEIRKLATIFWRVSMTLHERETISPMTVNLGP